MTTFVLSIQADDFETFRADVGRFADMISPPAQDAEKVSEEVPDAAASLRKILDETSLDDLHRIVAERFDREGFEVAIVAKPSPPAEEPPEEPPADKPPAKKRKGRPPLVDADTATRKLQGVDADPEADRAHVIAELSQRFNDPVQRAAVTEFSSRMSSRFSKDGEKLSLLPTEVFPEIRAEYEKEFV